MIAVGETRAVDGYEDLSPPDSLRELALVRVEWDGLRRRGRLREHLGEPPPTWSELVQPLVVAAFGRRVEIRATVDLMLVDRRTFLFLTDEHVVLVPRRPLARRAPAPEVVLRTEIADIDIREGYLDCIRWVVLLTLRAGRALPLWLDEKKLFGFERRRDYEDLRRLIGGSPGDG